MAIRSKRARDPRRIYCEQYGMFWKFTLPGFLTFCREGATYGRHDLNKFGKLLRGKPKGTYKSREKIQSYSGDSDVILFHPLDWHKGDYQQAAIDIKKWWNKRG